MSDNPSQDLRDFLGKDRFGCVMADPPWRFTNRTGKVAPEHKRLARYPTMTVDDICALPAELTMSTALKVGAERAVARRAAGAQGLGI